MQVDYFYLEDRPKIHKFLRDQSAILAIKLDIRATKNNRVAEG